ncbi:11063_t:CDS:10 [Ambispora leptoticha]|uniref:11063_t:CDS:1 n=1 Tax=Ambispora leptoticha TaxID=144679 RepID=A0A9N8Z9P8_9GLOM|nr:11063_t:CDS:10 [Ambispora leptoticha]
MHSFSSSDHKKQRRKLNKENIARLVFPSLSTGLGKVPVGEAVPVACDVINAFLSKHKINDDDNDIGSFELILYDPDLNVLKAYETQLSQHDKIKETRLRLVNELFTDNMSFISGLESRYIVCETTWRLKPDAHHFSKKILEAIGPELDSEIKKTYSKPGILIYVVSPNMSSTPVSITESKKLLNDAYRTMFDAFLCIIRGQKYTPKGQKEESKIESKEKPKSAFDVLMQGSRNSSSSISKSSLTTATASTASFGKKANKGFQWQNALLEYLEKPEKYSNDEMYHYDDEFVIVWDKFPKAKKHFLVIPRRRINFIDELTSDDLQLVQKMKEKGEWVIERMKQENPKLQFRMGFHTIPSMKQLHMHVVSQDFISPKLKNKKHWNSFTTGFFKDTDEILKTLQENGKLQARFLQFFFDKDFYEGLLKAPMKCHLCGKKMNTIPELKDHLLKHWNNE